MSVRELLIPELPAEEVRRRLAYHTRNEAIELYAEAFYLHEAKERRLYKAWGYRSISQYALHVLGFDPTKTSDLIRIGRKRKELQAIARAFEAGEIGWSKLRAITRKAVPETEAQWLAVAKAYPSAKVAEIVANTDDGAPPSPRPAPRPVKIPLRVDLPGPVFLRGEKAAARIRRLFGRGLSAAQVMDKMFAVVLDGGLPGEEVGRLEDVVVYHVCPRCAESWVETARGPVSVPKPVAEEAGRRGRVIAIAEPPEDPGEDAVILFGRRGDVPPEERDPPVDPELALSVLARDGFRCVICSRREDLVPHHLRSVSKAGKTEGKNLGSACGACHNLVHSGLVVLRVEGGRFVAYDAEGRRLRNPAGPAAELDPGDEDLPCKGVLVVPEDLAARYTAPGSEAKIPPGRNATEVVENGAGAAGGPDRAGEAARASESSADPRDPADPLGTIPASGAIAAAERGGSPSAPAQPAPLGEPVPLAEVGSAPRAPRAEPKIPPGRNATEW